MSTFDAAAERRLLAMANGDQCGALDSDAAAAAMDEIARLREDNAERVAALGSFMNTLRNAEERAVQQQDRAERAETLGATRKAALEHALKLVLGVIRQTEGLPDAWFELRAVLAAALEGKLGATGEPQ